MKSISIVRFGRVAAAVVALGMTAISASAANAVFNVSSGDWLVSSSWNPVAVPGSSDSVFIRSGRAASLAGNAGTVSAIYIGDANSSGELELNTGAALTAGTIQVGRLNQANPDGHLIVNQGSLSATTLLTIGGEQGSLNGGSGTMEFFNGSVSATTVTVGASSVGKAGTLCIHGNSGTFTGTNFNLNSKGKLRFTFAAGGITPLDFSGTATLSANAEIEIDGSAYTGGAATIPLIKATTFSGTAAVRRVFIKGFAPNYGATLAVNSTTQDLELTLTAITSNAGKFVERLRNGDDQTLVTYGTSITKLGFWTNQLMVTLDRQFPGQVTWVNSGNNGRNSKFGRNDTNLNNYVLSKNPDCVFIEFTINDSVDNGQVSPLQSRSNLEYIIDEIAADFPNCEIVLQLMNPAVEPDTARHDQEQYQQVYRDVAAARGLLLVDNIPGWEAIHYEGGSENVAAFKRLVPDGVHPNNTGVALVNVPNIIKTLDLETSYATWRTGYSPAASVDGQGNADSDTLKDGAEYQFAQNPNAAAAAGTLGTLADGVTACYRFPALLWRAEHPDYAITVETSPDGVTWTRLPFGRVEVSGVPTGTGVLLLGNEPSPTVVHPAGTTQIRFVASPRQ